MFLIDDLVGLPLDLTKKVLEGIIQQVDDEMLNNEAAVRKKYLDAVREHEYGQMNDEEYRATIAFLSDRLKAMKSEKVKNDEK